MGRYGTRNAEGLQKDPVKQIAIIGTVGVPANYGGFETLVENIIGRNNLQEIKYVVYCSSISYSRKRKTYKGADLQYIPIKANGWQSIFYDSLSMLHAIFSKTDVLLILGVSGCFILPFIRMISRKKIIVNIDGLEHRRGKWKPSIRKFLKQSEKIAIRYAHVIVTDNKAIQDYVKTEYGQDSALIAYGGDHVQVSPDSDETPILGKYRLSDGDYSFSLCRIEPENNVHVTLEAFARTGAPLVMIGNWRNSDYGKRLLSQFSAYPNIRMLAPIYDLPILNALHNHCKFYIHGHSAGGTNPSLVEAMFFGKPILAFDVIYNRETTANLANYYKDAEQLEKLLCLPYDLFAQNALSMVQIAKQRYLWSIISKQYEKLY